MKYFLFFFGFTLICRRGWTFILANKRIFYQNCEIFNNVDLYDGPVCGSDGITYANDLYLDCVNYQTFQNVISMHSGYCLPVDDYCKINLFYRPICGSDGHTYTNLESLSCVNYNRSQNVTVALSGPCKVTDRCYGYKTLSYSSNPVCANNGLTYGNAAQVNCLRQINVDLRILHNGSCTVREVHDIYDSVEKICDIANSRFEWNPVCASDGVTYHNPFKFLCYKARDLNTLVSDNECEKNTQFSCARLKSSTKTFGAKDEVCGNDGVTYQSIHHLQCHNNQNKYLSLKHSGACVDPDDNPCRSIPEESLRFPVCGSDNLSYVSPEALWCAKLRFPDKNVTVALSGPCKVTDRCYGYKTLSYSSNPVCANNGLTYGNAAQVNCLRQINVDLRILHNGSCTVREVHDIYDSVEKICDIANSRFEWNPVCASDGVTYHNPFKFLCYKARDLRILHNGSCTVREVHDIYDSVEKICDIANSRFERNQVYASDGVAYPNTFESSDHLDHG